MSADHRPSAVDKLLRLFTDVRGGESGTALLLGLNVFLLLTSYYVIKPVREALILTGGGAEVKSYAAAGQAVLLLILVPIYAALAGRLPRRRLINVVTIFFILCLVAFFLLAHADLPLGVIFFLWVGIFNLMVIAQFWSYANDVYTTDEGKRLFPIVAFGASLGAVVGSVITSALIKPLGVYQLLLVAAGLLAAAMVITNVVDRREGHPTTAGAGPSTDGEKPVGVGANAFGLVLKNRYLLLIALLMLVLNWVNTTGEYILGRTVADAADKAIAAGQAGGLDKEGFIGKFYSDFFGVVNVVGLVLQLFVVSRILKYLGVRIAILALPVIALIGYGALAFVPLLSVVRWAKTAENATDYSLQNTVRNVLFLPTTREEKYKAKQAIDSFFVRMGDVFSAGLVFLGASLLHLGTSQFAIVNLALVGVWLVLAIWIGRENAKLTEPGAAARGAGAPSITPIRAEPAGS